MDALDATLRQREQRRMGNDIIRTTTRMRETPPTKRK